MSLFTSWTEKGLSNALSVVGKFVAPYEENDGFQEESAEHSLVHPENDNFDNTVTNPETTENVNVHIQTVVETTAIIPESTNLVPILSVDDCSQLVKANETIISLQNEIFSLKESIEKDNLNSSAEIVKLRDSLRAQSQSISNLEDEKKQLNMVIMQLRQHRRGAVDESEAILLERNTLKASVEGYHAQISQLQREMEGVKLRVESERVRELEQELVDYKRELDELKEIYSKTKLQLLQMEKACVDYEKDLSTSNADIQVLQLDLLHKDAELSNLRGILNNFERECKANLKIASTELENKISAAVADERERNRAALEDCSQNVSKLSARITELESLLDTERLLRRKADIEVQRAKAQIEDAVAEAKKEKAASDEEVSVDRSVMASLFVNYIEKGRNIETLKLIGNMLHFTEEQRIAVGLEVPKTLRLFPGLSSLLGSFVASSSGSEENRADHMLEPIDTSVKAKKKEENGNLSELFVNFLLEEADPEHYSAAAILAKERREEQSAILGPRICGLGPVELSSGSSSVAAVSRSSSDVSVASLSEFENDKYVRSSPRSHYEKNPLNPSAVLSRVREMNKGGSSKLLVNDSSDSDNDIAVRARKSYV